MATTKAKILTQVNKNLLTESLFSGTDIDVEIQLTLDDMSEEDLLVASATPAVTSGDLTIDVPAGYRSAIAITLTDAAGIEHDPLKKLPRGQNEYRNLRDNDSSTGIPNWYSEFNDKFFLWRPANQDFTSVIEYYKNHAQSISSIEFNDQFNNAIYAGVTYKVAVRINRQSGIDKWLPIYEDAKKKRSNAMTRQPRIIRG